MTDLTEVYESEALDLRERGLMGWAHSEGWRLGFLAGVMITAGEALILWWVLR